MRARYNKIDITQEIRRNNMGCRSTTSGSAIDTNDERVEGGDAGENILVEEGTEESAGTMCMRQKTWQGVEVLGIRTRIHPKKSRQRPALSFGSLSYEWIVNKSRM